MALESRLILSFNLFSEYTYNGVPYSSAISSNRSWLDIRLDSGWLFILVRANMSVYFNHIMLEILSL
jgi:hypothetical protein